VPEDDTAWRTAWDKLTYTDSAQAFPVMKLLLARPQAESLRILRWVLPSADVSAGRIRALLADLNHEDRERRERAGVELGRCLGEAESALRAELEATTSEEVRQRIRELLLPLDDEYAEERETLRVLRVIWVLRHLGTPEARGILEELAGGAPRARPTRAARAALDWLHRRAQLAP
jgi:hypothetical protein